MTTDGGVVTLKTRARVSARGKGAIAMAKSPATRAEKPAPPQECVTPRPTSFETIVLEPKGEHKATVVWLHGLGQSGAGFAEDLKKYNQLHPTIKWILPTAPLRDVEIRGEPCTAWYNATPIFEEGHFIDLEGLDSSAERVADFLLTEATKGADGAKKVKLAVGGFSQGCAMTLYVARCSIIGTYGNGRPFPVKLDAAIALGGWMPTIKTFEDEVNEAPGARHRAGELPMFFGHCEDDNVIPIWQAHASTTVFGTVGTTDITFKTYPEGGHACVREEADDLGKWLATKLELDKPVTSDETVDGINLTTPALHDPTTPVLQDDVTCP